MIKVALLHPSYGRPRQAFHAFKEWESMVEKPEEVEYLLGLDDTDPSLDEYLNLFSCDMKFARNRTIINSTHTIVEAFNEFPKHISNSVELFVGMADDMATLQGWDVKLWGLIKDMSKPAYLHVNDGMFPMEHPWSNYLIINRAFYNRVGHMLCPAYDGVVADVELSAVAKILGAVIKAPDLLFQHNHFCIGRSEMDDTYRRHNTEEKTVRNRAIFEERKKRNFDL